MEKQEKIYNDIIEFYDFAESLLETADSNKIHDPINQLDFIEPFVEQIELAIDDLAEEYRYFIRTGEKPNIVVRHKIARAFKDIYEVLGKCRKINNLKKEKQENTNKETPDE